MYVRVRCEARRENFLSFACLLTFFNKKVTYVYKTLVEITEPALVVAFMMVVFALF